MTKQLRNKIPQIRFCGFDLEWEKKSLGELCEPLAYGLNAAATKYDGENKYLRITDIDDESRTFLKTSLTSPNVDLATSQSYLLQQRDIVFARTGASVGKSYLYKEADGRVFFAGFLIRARVKADESPDFIFQNTLTKKYDGFVKLTSQRSGQPGINAKEYSSFSFLNPTEISEKNQIGIYFKELDRLIELYQHKHSKLMILKQAMLQKMFPQNSFTTPEVRFKGFVDDWEFRNLKDISKKVTDKNISRKYRETFTNSAELGIVSQRDYFDKDISNSSNIGGYYVVEPENFVYNPRISFFAPCGPVSRNSLGRTGVMSPLYTVFRTHNVDNTFLEYFFKTNLWHSFMFLNGDTGARADRFSIKDSVFMELPIPYPKLEEQQRIGLYFRKLDELISQHSTQLGKLKQIKSACLEKMFV